MNKAKEVLERHPELMAYFIYAGSKGENVVWYSKALQNKIIDQ